MSEPAYLDETPVRGIVNSLNRKCAESARAGEWEIAQKYAQACDQFEAIIAIAREEKQP